LTSLPFHDPGQAFTRLSVTPQKTIQTREGKTERPTLERHKRRAPDSSNRSKAGELIESIHASVTQFRETTPQADDMTLVVLKTL
jgi:hypothetical protein